MVILDFTFPFLFGILEVYRSLRRSVGLAWHIMVTMMIWSVFKVRTGQVAISRPRYSESTRFKRPTPLSRLRFRQSTTRFNSVFRVPVSTLRSGIPILVLQLSYEYWTNRSNTVVSQNQNISFAHVCREHNCFSSDTKNPTWFRRFCASSLMVECAGSLLAARSGFES